MIDATGHKVTTLSPQASQTGYLQPGIPWVPEAEEVGLGSIAISAQMLPRDPRGPPQPRGRVAMQSDPWEISEVQSGQTFIL